MDIKETNPDRIYAKAAARKGTQALLEIAQGAVCFLVPHVGDKLRRHKGPGHSADVGQSFLGKRLVYEIFKTMNNAFGGLFMHCLTSRGLCLLFAALCLSLAVQAKSGHTAQPQQQSQTGSPAAPAEQPGGQQTQTISPEALFATMLMSAEKGQPQAMLAVGTLYEQGIGVPRHFTKAFEWYGKAANAGNKEAWHRLGVCHEIGVGVTADLEKALEAYTKAAALGFSPAQYKLANMYLRGHGVAKDESKGVDYLSQAAEGGEVAAMFDMGQMLRNGMFGRKAEPEKARQWYAKAAEAGHAQSLLTLADMLKNGQGGRADHEGALRWFLIGQKGGMSGEPLDAVIKELRGKLSAAKAQEAEKAADAWIAARAKGQEAQGQ